MDNDDPFLSHIARKLSSDARAQVWIAGNAGKYDIFVPPNYNTKAMRGIQITQLVAAWYRSCSSFVVIDMGAGIACSGTAPGSVSIATRKMMDFCIEKYQKVDFSPFPCDTNAKNAIEVKHAVFNSPKNENFNQGYNTTPYMRARDSVKDHVVWCDMNTLLTTTMLSA